MVQAKGVDALLVFEEGVKWVDRDDKNRGVKLMDGGVVVRRVVVFALNGEESGGVCIEGMCFGVKMLLVVVQGG